LGNKISGDSYSQQDINLLTNLSNQTSISLQNALLYSEVKGFSKKLEIKIKEATRELRETYEKLKKLDKAKSEFISIASHQLRTPLTAIKGYIAMLLEGSYGQLPQNSKHPMENVYKSNERLIRLVNNLLNVSRIEAGKMGLTLEKSSLESIILSVIEELEIEAKKKNIYLKFKKPEKTLTEILIDKDKIRQVILNIIDNAIKYTNQGGITINLESQLSKLVISVSDTGEGMTKEELASIFETFSRGTAGTLLHTEGAGLGLYIARKFLEMHKGRIWAKSLGKGKGSIFYVELPVFH